jgi:hypothetical protein
LLAFPRLSRPITAADNRLNLDRDTGEAPSILGLFKEAETSPPQGLTGWDQALLHAVYNSRQTDRMQISEIQTATLDAVANSAP